MSPNLRNGLLVARREYTWRIRQRAFILATAVLVLLGSAAALAPIIVQAIGHQGPHAIALSVQGSPALDVQAALTAALDPDPSQPAFVIRPVGDVAAARQEAVSGHLSGVLVVTAANGDLTYTYYTTGGPLDQTQAQVQAAMNAVVSEARLLAAGLDQAQIAHAFTPPQGTITPADPSQAAGTAPDAASEGLGFVMSIIIFMAILVYGQWIAMSVAEEKSSRVMEVILNAASPVQLLTGKLLGVGALAMTQYACIAAPTLLLLWLRAPIEDVLFGTSTATTPVASGLTASLLLAFGAFFLLGFGLYALLYAGVASLVSRQEDLNPILGPLTMLSTMGYLLAAWTSAGIIALPAAVIGLLSYVPFLSPYLMLSRYASGQASAMEAAVALVILAASVLVALVVAARLYSAGVLMYGQRPSMRRLFAVLRQGS